MSRSEKLKQALDQRFKKMMYDNVYLAKVTAVDIDTQTCDVIALDSEVEDFDVRLRPDVNTGKEQGILIVPGINSIVLVGTNPKYGKVVLQVDEPSEVYVNCAAAGTIYLNGKDFSMTKTETLQAELNKLKANVALIINAIKNGTPAPGSADGGTAYKTSMTAILAAEQTVDFSQIKNEKIKHG